MQVVVTGSFDDLRSRHVRFLEEASKLGDVHVLLWSDEAVRALEGQAPKLPEAERAYLLQANRYVEQVTLVTSQVERDAIPQVEKIRPDDRGWWTRRTTMLRKEHFASRAAWDIALCEIKT